MSTNPFTDFLPEVLPYVHDCPQFVAVTAIRNAAIEFCNKSRIWQVDELPVDVLVGQSLYTPVAPTGTVLVDVMEAWYDGKLLPPKSSEELTRLFRWADWRTYASDPQFITRNTPDTLMLVPTPIVNKPAGLTLKVALAPAREAVGIDSFIYQTYLEDIAAGARARLYTMAGQPFYDPASATQYQRMFHIMTTEARIRANKGLTRSSVAMEFPRF